MAKAPTELTPDTLIKRVMSGTKEYRTKEYLEAFGKISSTRLHSPEYSRLEIIKLWNSLQNTPNKCRYFTFSLVDHNYFVKQKIEEYYSSAKWAYICHDKDKSAEHKHYHYVLMFDSPRSFASIANDLEIPVTMLQKVYSKKGILDYLTHENDPNKYHYSLSEITSNFDVDEEKKKDDGKTDYDTEFKMYCKMRDGLISREEFFEYWKSVLCDIKLPPNQRLQMYERVCNASTGASLSTRAEFCVPHPCNEKPIQTRFPASAPELVPWIDNGSMPFVVGTPPAPHKKRKSYAKPNPRADLS